MPVATGAYPGESDITLEPIPSTTPTEGNPAQCTGGPNNYIADQHTIVVDRAKCVVYETFNTSHCNGAWSADQQSVWDMNITEQRPYTYTSADAAGLSVFEGLIRYDEIVAGAINHAIRFTAQHTKNDASQGYFTAPATHAAGTLWGTDNIMGMRLRLKASFDISGYSATNQIILKAMKQYGMILADNGSNMFFQGTPDPRWDDGDLNALKAVPSSAFDVVQMATVYDSSTAPTGAAPQITSFTASRGQRGSGDQRSADAGGDGQFLHVCGRCRFHPRCSDGYAASNDDLQPDQPQRLWKHKRQRDGTCGGRRACALVRYYPEPDLWRRSVRSFSDIELDRRNHLLSGQRPGNDLG